MTEPAGAVEAPLTDLEIQRLEIIRRNRERLIALGIIDAVNELRDIQQDLKALRSRQKRPPAEPTRRSTRLRDAEHVRELLEREGAEEGTELHRAITEGRCPRCHELLTEDFSAHLAACEAAPHEEQEQERKGAREPKRKPGRSMEEKLGELAVGGLVDVTEEHAKFVCIGSTGNHYVVTLQSDQELQGCQCVDHRVRKRNCKHIHMIWKSLGLGPEQWREWREGVDRAVGVAALAMPEGGSGEEGEGEGEGEEEGGERGAQPPERKRAKGGRGRGRGKRGRGQGRKKGGKGDHEAVAFLE